MKTAFIGHRQIFSCNLSDRLIAAIKTEIKNGCTNFTVGTHGQFDDTVLRALKTIRRNNPNIQIEVVITSLNQLKKRNAYGDIPYTDVDTVMYEIEEAHYKQKITVSNKLMIDTCDTLICYVDKNVYRSGAKTAMNYAKKNGVKIINLYREDDDPLYGLSKEEKEHKLKEFLSTPI